MPKRTIIIIIIIVVVSSGSSSCSSSSSSSSILLVITCMQGIYNYIPITVFLGYVMLQQFCVYNLCYL
jgi:hypothetical protein